ncbi:MAG: DUF2924 domain-containing protein [Alphaproteobacteria bacterium]|nr:DUF2924 domain-containing protein [Alphaproteobacteria bacterium]
MIMPTTYEELKALDKPQLEAIWEHFFKSPVIASASNLHRPLWYKIQCARYGQKLEQRHITRLNTYSLDPDAYIEKALKTKYHLKHGTEIVKTFKGKEYVVRVENTSVFSYLGEKYSNLSAIAMKICGHKVSGNEFFGLMNKNTGRVSA